MMKSKKEIKNDTLKLSSNSSKVCMCRHLFYWVSKYMDKHDKTKDILM